MLSGILLTVKKVDRFFDSLVFNGYIRFDLLYVPETLIR